MAMGRAQVQGLSGLRPPEPATEGMGPATARAEVAQGLGFRAEPGLVSSGAHRVPLREGDALLVIDMQRDFMPGGRLAVPGAAAVVGPLNACLDRFARRGLPVFASRDWHPPGHCSFQTQGGPWPEHCVAGTLGAAFAEAVRLPPTVGIVSKGWDFTSETSSAFVKTDLHVRLLALGVRRLFVAGLATDAFVLATAADGRDLGYEVFLLSDAVAGLGARPQVCARAFERMQQTGTVLINSHALQA
jgi:nicotinamidase/pyrazinamidase